jgi:hypothetical protein
MSIHKSYFSRNNTLIYNSYTNTGRNPVTELFFGTTAISQYPIGYSRFIFDLDLDSLIAKLTNGVISTTCSTMKHTLRMTNTSNFDIELLNTFTSQGRLRATSFDLLLLRIPPINFDPSLPQIWDEGVGYDFADLQYQYVITDRNYSTRPSNWFETTTIGVWEENGIYNNRNLSLVPFSALTLVAEQHFEFGDENIEFDMTNEINGILNNTISGVTGWVIAYKPQLELFSGLTDTYEVQFFTRHTQTFYEPHLDTSYNDLIEDDRNLFTLGKVNKLYLYLYEDGNPLNLDFLPLINIIDNSGNPILGLTGLTGCQRTQGVYEVTIPPLMGYKTPCTFSDKWYNLSINGFPINPITNDFTLQPMKNSIQIGTSSQDPKKAYTTNRLLPKVSAYYRVYVREGQTEVQVQDWTQINRTPNEYYFIFDTRDKIPNEYYIDIKVESSGEVNTYKRQIKFQIVNYK